MSGPVRPAMPGLSIRTAYFWPIMKKILSARMLSKSGMDRNPNITFTGLREIQADILLGKEGARAI